MDKPEVHCKHCFCIQPYDLNNPPENCKQCGARFSNWHVAQQLEALKQKADRRRGELGRVGDV